MSKQTQDESTQADVACMDDKAKEAPPPVNITTPVQLEELDFLRYQRDLALLQKLQITVSMYEREQEHTRIAMLTAAQVHSRHTAYLASKYNVDLNAMMVSDDGFFMPRPPQQVRR